MAITMLGLIVCLIVGMSIVQSGNVSWLDIIIFSVATMLLLTDFARASDHTPQDCIKKEVRCGS